VPSGEAALNGGHCALPVDIMAHMKPCHFVVATVGLWSSLAGMQSASSQAKSSAPPAQSAAVTVPFVGCASDGQVGPQAAPSGTSKAVTIPAALAKRLAYYKAEYGVGVLAPRGWHCFSTYGSDGSNLFVSPDPIDPKAPFAEDWKGFSGQAIQVSVSLGGTSGRFQVAKIIARVFPDNKSFVQDVLAEGIESASSFPFGPYPKDKLTYRSKSVVEFETPANTEGLGTNSQLQVGSGPIDGVAILSVEDTDLILLSVRLNERDRDLIPTIIGQVEKESAGSGAQ